ncbi:hypothetical protein L1887_05098 [Cichorium endivia]|nr:hypothetical protein L1887_05098 [Cichorium endivia]
MGLKSQEMFSDISLKRVNVEALRWFRLDYEVSIYLLEKQLLPTCESLGEVYLLQHFKDALLYQKKHLELAKDSDDLIEQQRAAYSTKPHRSTHMAGMKTVKQACKPAKENGVQKKGWDIGEENH